MLFNATKVEELKKKAEKAGGSFKVLKKYQVDLPQLMKVKSVTGEVNKNNKNVLTVEFEHAKLPSDYPTIKKFYYVDGEFAMEQVIKLVGCFGGDIKSVRDIADLTSQVKKFVGKSLKMALRLKPSFFTKVQEDESIKAFSTFNYDVWYVGSKDDENFGVDSSKVVLMPDDYYNNKLEAFQEEYNDIEIQYTAPEKYFSTYVEEKSESQVELESATEETKDLLPQSTVDDMTSDDAEDDDLPF